MEKDATSTRIPISCPKTLWPDLADHDALLIHDGLNLELGPSEGACAGIGGLCGSDRTRGG